VFPNRPQLHSLFLKTAGALPYHPISYLRFYSLSYPYWFLSFFPFYGLCGFFRVRVQEAPELIKAGKGFFL